MSQRVTALGTGMHDRIQPPPLCRISDEWSAEGQKNGGRDARPDGKASSDGLRLMRSARLSPTDSCLFPVPSPPPLPLPHADPGPGQSASSAADALAELVQTCLVRSFAWLFTSGAPPAPSGGAGVGAGAGGIALRGAASPSSVSSTSSAVSGAASPRVFLGEVCNCCWTCCCCFCCDKPQFR